jgi:hypothetical protein
LSKAQKLKGQVTTVIAQASSESCDRERLAGGSSHENVNWVIFVALDAGEIPMQGDMGIMMLKHSTGEGFNLRKERRLPA